MKEWKIGVGPFYISEEIKERAGGGFAFCAFRVAVEEMLSHSCRDGGMLEDSGACSGLRAWNNSSPRNVRGYKNCWHTDTQIVEIKWRARSGSCSVRGKVIG